MTYLDLLIRIRQNTQPELIEVALNDNGKLYFQWTGDEYRRTMFGNKAVLSECFTEKQMVENDCIKALIYEDESDSTIADEMIRKCF